MKKKVILLSLVVVLVIAVSISLFNNEDNGSDKLNLAYNEQHEENEKKQEIIDLIDVDDLSEEFIENYFEESKKLNLNDNKENILIVISSQQIEDGYGATDIVAAPNNQYFLQYKNEKDKNKALKKFQEDDSIVSVEENKVYTIDSSEYNSWGVESMGLDYASSIVESKNLNEVTVAIMDTGLDVDLFNKYYPGKLKETYSVVNQDDNTEMVDLQGHGTHIAGTIAESTPSNVKIIALRTSLEGAFHDTDVISALNYIVYYEKADVINMSFGGANDPSEAVYQAIQSAKEKKIICVAAAGNDSSSDNHYPSSFDNTISISSVDSNLNRSLFSNYGSSITFAAPGTDIRSIMGVDTMISYDNGNNDDNEHEIISGTSMATPHAVSAIAILKSFNKNITMENVIDILKEHTIDIGIKGWDKYFGYGYIYLNNEEFCDGENCDEFNIFKLKEHENISEVEFPSEYAPTLLNYGNETNIMNMDIKFYYDTDKYFYRKLGELDDVEVINYNAFDYTVQDVIIRYNKNEYEVSIDNSVLSDSDLGWEYELIDDNSIKLKKFFVNNFAPVRVIIPSQINNKQLIIIGSDSFKNAKYSSVVVIPETVQQVEQQAFYMTDFDRIDIRSNNLEIGEAAFGNNKLLTTINGEIGSSGEIGMHAFSNCDLLQNITLSEKLKIIGRSAFQFDKKLKYINLPNGLETIKQEAFNECSSIGRIILPDSLLKIERDAFTRTKITSIKIPKKVNSLDVFSFDNLDYIEVDSGNITYDSRNNCNCVVRSINNSLEIASNNTIIPNNIQFINRSSFFGNKSITDVVIPLSVDTIINNAFENCQNLKNITLSNNVVNFGPNIFKNTNDVTLWVYNNSEAKNYAVENNLKYKTLDPIDVEVNLKKNSYNAFETVDLESIRLEFDDGGQQRFEYLDDEDSRYRYEIKYSDENSNFRYGDTEFSVLIYDVYNNFIEKKVPVTVSKLVPEYILPTNIKGYIGQKLSQISLPNGFEWMDGNLIVEEQTSTYKIKYVPEDADNYETIENINLDIIVSENTINNYTKDEKTIKGINLNTKLSDYIHNFDYSNIYEIKVYKGETLLTDNDLVGTGSIVKIYENDDLKEQYTNIVLGDVTGNGKTGIGDVAKLYQYFKGKITMDDCYKQAGDVVSNGSIKINDVAKLYQFVKGKISKLD